jgi:hypothetical protein
MPRGRALSDDSRWIILHMSATLNLDDIVYHSGVSRRTVERILADFRQRGTGNRLQVSKRLLGASRALTTENEQVFMLFLLSFSC